MSKVPSVIDWAQLPLTCEIAHVQQLTGLSARAIERLVRMNRFVSPMFARPMRWSRADLQRQWERGRAK